MNKSLQHFKINKDARALLNDQKPFCVWFTGLSGSGKSTIANALEIELFRMQRRTYILDGDNLRHGLNDDLGFSDQDRTENIRRVSEIARLMVDAGLIVLVPLISPFEKERALAKSKFLPHEFIEVFVSTTLQDCEARDPKGLYKKARSGEIPNFTGIGSRYEPPSHPDLTIDTKKSLSDIMGEILTALNAKGLLSQHHL
jgi:bifunctional enzyme CysN/CysC